MLCSDYNVLRLKEKCRELNQRNINAMSVIRLFQGIVTFNNFDTDHSPIEPIVTSEKTLHKQETSDMEAYQIKHTRENSFSCNHCGKSFSQKGSSICHQSLICHRREEFFHTR